jgi:protein TonB
VKTIGKVIGSGLEEESIRVVKAMPKWEPGKQDGKVVSVQFNLPIRYVLQ